jgi:three-Cys-motif partner protein
MPKRFPYDDIGYWSEIKLDIVREYAAGYSKIMSDQRSPSFFHVYIDAFAGAGIHIARSTGGLVAGSPLNALFLNKLFKEYHFVELDKVKADSLRSIAGDRKNVYIHEGDCNQILIEKVFPLVRYENYRRGLCLLDPYGLHLHWEVIKMAGAMKSMEIFLNFPIMDMNRNVLLTDPDRVDHGQVDRMNAFWGDESWRKMAYESQPGLFWEMEEKNPNEAVVAAFRKRLIEVAGFKFVPEPLPMRNKQNTVVYYLFFASQNEAGRKIVTDIFRKYSQRVTV